ncbi:MAG: ScyD/ScyE family protein [Saprospiraceae bacterium]
MKKSLIFLFALLTMNLIQAQLVTKLSGLSSAIGVTVDEWGNQWVTDQGTGNNDGRVYRVTKSGKKDLVFKDLTSSISPEGDAISAWKVIPMSYGRMALLMGGNHHLTSDHGRLMFFDLSGFVPGVDSAKTLADTTHSFDIATYGQVVSGKDDSDPFGAVQDEDGNWYIADAAADAIIRISRNGKNYSVLAKFTHIKNPTPVGGPFIDVVPTGIVALPQYGGFLVTTLTGFPFLEGLASIYKVDRDGTVTPYLTGLTLLTGIAIDKFNTIYVAQFGKFDLPTGFVFGSGQVIRIRNHKIIDTVASGYGPGAGMAIYEGRKLYVTSLFTGEMLGGDIPGEGGIAPAWSSSLESRDRDLIQSLSLNTYPNPTSDRLQVSWNNKVETGNIQLQITDISGRTFWQQKNVNALFGQKLIDVSSFAPGTYVLTLSSLNGSSNQKFNVIR